MFPDAATDRPPAAALGARPRTTLVVASLATFLVLVNFTLPLSTLPDIAGGLGADAAGRTWILGGVSLGLSALLLVTGALADSYGRKLLFVSGAAALVIASTVCAAASTTTVFVVGRILQGGASAALTASGLGLLAAAFPPGQARARATGLWGAMIGAGVAAGPIVSALLTKVGGWRTPYAVVTLAAVALGGSAARTLHDSRSQHRHKPDLLGFLSFAGAVSCLSAGLIEGPGAWHRWAVLGFFAAAAALLAGFVVVERHSAHPMIDLGLFRRSAFLASTVGALTLGVSVIGLLTYIPLEAQTLFGFGPLQAAGVLTTWSFLSFLVAPQAHRLTRHLGTPLQLTGGLLACGAGELAIVGVTDQSPWWQLIPGLALAGLGTGLANAALASLAVHSVPTDRVAMGSGANNTARYLGSSLGVALIAAVLASAPRRSDAATTFAAGMTAAAVVAAVLLLAGTTVVIISRGARHLE